MKSPKEWQITQNSQIFPKKMLKILDNINPKRVAITQTIRFFQKKNVKNFGKINPKKRVANYPKRSDFVKNFGRINPKRVANFPK